MNINEKSEPVNKTPFNFTPKQQISKKSGGTNKIKSYTFLDNENAKIVNDVDHIVSPIKKKSSLTKSLMPNYEKKNSSIESAIEDIDFITRKEYIDHRYCNICSKEFPNFMKKIKTKHCKICGNAVCGDCSSERIKDKRACDLCIYKLKNKQEEDLREEYLIHYEECIKEMEIQLQNMENSIDGLKNKTLTLSTQSENEILSSKKHIKELDKIIYEAEGNELQTKSLYEKLLKEFVFLSEDLKKLKLECEKKEEEKKEKQNEITKKKALLQEKTKEFKKQQNELKKITF